MATTRPLPGGSMTRGQGALSSKRAVGPGVVVVIEVARQDASEVGLVEHDDMIQTLAPDRADQPFDVGILPGRPRRGQHFLDPHTASGIPESISP